MRKRWFLLFLAVWSLAFAVGDLNYARQLIERGEYALAAVTLKKQLKDYPVEARYLLAEVYMLEGQLADATMYLESAREQGLDETRYYAMRGRLALLEGEWDTAWASLRSAVALSGLRQYALDWGLVGLAQGNLERAKLGFEKAQREGAVAEGEFLEGLALLAVSPDKALAKLRAAQAELSAESPLKPQVIYWQARALERLGQKNEARSTLRFLLRTYPDYGPARDALNRLGP
ncbi:tetratricopeptide repeat protein [Oceanithermus sp.]